MTKPVFSLQRLAAYGLATNAGWELMQCVAFYDMWDWDVRRAMLWMAVATLADGVLVLSIVTLVGKTLGWRCLWPPNARGWAVLIFIGLVIGVAVEWAAQHFQLWGYSSLMPEITLFGYALGVTPLLQMALLPGLSAHLAALRTK